MESKGFFFTVAPIITIILIFGYLNIQQEMTLNPGESISTDLCKSIEYNGEDRIDVLFISSKEDAERYTEFLLNTEPYKSYRNYFNSYVIEGTSPPCKDYKGIAILCNTPEVQSIAKQCPHDYIVVVKEEPSNIRSSAYGNILSINKIHEDSVLIHEFGHSFGNLAEEYGGAKLPSGQKNCVSSCDKFKGPIDSCEKECSESNYYRSIPSGVMRTLLTSNYGIYNKEIISALLEKNKPKDTTVTGMQISEPTISCDNQILSVDIIQNSNQKMIAETDNVLKEGCAPNNAGDGTLCINNLCYPDVIFTDGQNIQTQETIEGEIIPYQERSIFYVEQNPASPLVEITVGGELINTINTAQAGATACHL